MSVLLYTTISVLSQHHISLVLSQLQILCTVLYSTVQYNVSKHLHTVLYCIVTPQNIMNAFTAPYILGSVTAPNISDIITTPYSFDAITAPYILDPIAASHIMDAITAPYILDAITASNIMGAITAPYYCIVYYSTCTVLTVLCSTLQYCTVDFKSKLPRVFSKHPPSAQNLNMC